MTNSDPVSLLLPTFFGGTKAITTTPVVGTPRGAYAEIGKGRTSTQDVEYAVNQFLETASKTISKKPGSRL
jgi:hypothetical protein